MAAEQRKMYEDFFDKTDAMGQKDGSVSIMELKKMVVEGLGQKKTDREIAEMFRDIDKNGDGQITKEEFLSEMMKTERKTAVKEAFQKIDKSGDGKLQKAEVAAAMRDIGHFTEEEIDKMIKKADKNNDGVIDLEEFEKEVY
uniref:Calmodulin, striated muscle-like isoform X3 n=1 Tax=Crassostrea virginica TaxID=6565 RepID=A0A8B8BK96_CRAVI|nr:calmodulin, striated muscle-like isoform X3 [Crassostrea virginica]XP_022303728.1 calmodulin, striated muscle-like isoform X3 [Crassostrea virginica]|mmetsp:Transcript_26958/g.43400  ORF Transcript_26958/g.43400 Transcript_26958/m.43400 type:complete len:142 (-) Transcript_26958:46-471(-)